jgi:hypothetical protein
MADDRAAAPGAPHISARIFLFVGTFAWVNSNVANKRLHWLIDINSAAPTRRHWRGQLRLMSARRFPPPWPVDETTACLIVRDHNAQALAYVYFEDEPGRRTAAKLLTRDQARRIAANMATLPGFLKRPQY